MDGNPNTPASGMSEPCIKDLRVKRFILASTMANRGDTVNR
jgi:hypothetical protein